jgi:hypothetical protein
LTLLALVDFAVPLRASPCSDYSASGIFNAPLARHGAIFAEPLADVNWTMNRAMA